jgi:hypothetical protein
MALLRASDVINGAFDLIGMGAANSSAVTAEDSADALRRLNNLLAGWNTSPLTIAFNTREVFSVTANVGTYTIGPGGTFNTVRPQAVTGAGLLLNSSSPVVEIPVALLNDDEYEAIQIKGLTSLLFTYVYYNATIASGYGTVTLWPIPTTAVNDLVLYSTQATAAFADLTTSYQFPPGYAEALEYNLAVRLSTPYSKPLAPEIVGLARESLGAIKRQNLQPLDLPMDPALTADRRYGYNIITGQ